MAKPTTFSTPEDIEMGGRMYADTRDALEFSVEFSLLLLWGEWHGVVILTGVSLWGEGI